MAEPVRLECVTHERGQIKGRVLVVDDDIGIGLYYKKILETAGFVADQVTSLGDMCARLNSLSYDVVLLDLHLGEEHGFDGLSIILKDAPYTKVYVLTADGTVQRAVEALRRGATGFFEKNGDIKALIEELETATEVPAVSDETLSDIGLIGRSPALLEVVEKIKRLRSVDSMVLLLGESGTGKEVIARAIHRTSRRAAQRFDAINCGAIPEALLESELFGHKRGAFTDAKADRKGIFELCSEGTLLLDEIGDMPLSLQIKLLRVLQEREVTPVGSATSVKINTRVIAATHRDILAEARAKRFREDLYFRLSIVVLRIPPLRERREDIPALVEHFLAIYNRRFGREVRMPAASEMTRLMAYDWPGNVRELQNALERAVVLSVKDEIDFKDVFAHLNFGQMPTIASDAIASDPSLPVHDGELPDYDLPLTAAKQAFERRYLQFQLKRCKGQVAAVAEKSGRYRADVYRMLSRYGLDHGDFRN